MCQLLGLSFNQEIRPVIPFSIFMTRSIAHPDGWGLAAYPGESSNAVVFKEPMPGYTSQLADFLIGYRALKSKIFIGHIRRATRGGLSYQNTHPFNRCYAGREFVFAHNGTLRKRNLLKRLTWQPNGETDSERGFCYLLTQLKRNDIKPLRFGQPVEYEDMDFRVIHEILHEINTITDGIFNCVFSDGKYLFAYRDMEEARNLFYKKYKNTFEETEMLKNVISKNLYMENSHHCHGYVVATEPLDDEGWHSFTGGNLMVFKDGNIVASLY